MGITVFAIFPKKLNICGICVYFNFISKQNKLTVAFSTN